MHQSTYSVRSSLSGEWTIERYSRGAGLYLGSIRARNTITSAGIALFLDLVRGASSSFLNGSLSLELRDGSNALIKSFANTDANYPETTGTPRQLRWQWSDATTDTYTVVTVKLLRGATEFSSATPSFAGGNTKPADEIWRYRYTLTIGGDGRFTEPVSFGAGALYPGLEHMLHTAAGMPDGAPWDTGNTQALIYDAAGYGNLIGTLTAPSVSRTSSTNLRYVFTAGAGVATGTWQWIAVQNIFDFDRILRIVEEAEGSKASGASWTWTYDFTLS